MRKLLLFLCLFMFTFALHAQVRDKPYDFPIKPKSEKWQSLKSVDEMYNVCQIPVEVLNNLTTAALLQTCLNYPVQSILLLHNTPQQSFEDWRLHFNGIGELLNRKDLGTVTLSAYEKFDTKGHLLLNTSSEKGAYTFKLSMLENIVSQTESINNYTSQQQKRLLRISLAKYDEIESDAVYGFSSLASIGRIITRIAERLGSAETKKQVSTAVSQEFIKSGFLKDRQALVSVISGAKNINTNE